MSHTFDQLYEQDIDSSSGGDFTSVSATSTGVAGTLPNAKPAAYKSKVSKGGKKYKKPGKPILKMGSSRGPDDPEFRDNIH